MSVGVIVPGLFGKMGSLIAQAAMDDPQHVFLGGTERPDSSHVGKTVASFFKGGEGAPLVQDGLENLLAQPLLAQPVEETKSRVLIDYTAPKACLSHLQIAKKHRIPMVIGTTGLTDEILAEIDKASTVIPVLRAANTSLGANLLGALTQIAAKALPDADVEITEIHHRQKADAPSGTALMLGEAAAKARGTDLEQVQQLSRAGQAPRKKGELGIFGIRGGLVPGEHTVYFFLDGERIELIHRVQDRKIFARGALAAARTLATKGPGLYSMMDVLDLAP